MLCFDSSDGYSEYQKDAALWARKTYGKDIVLGGGNIVDGEAFVFEDFLIAQRVQVGETVRELDLVAIDGNRTKRPLFLGQVLGEITPVDRKKPAHPRPFILQIPRGTIDFPQMNNVFFQIAEHEREHVEEVNAYIRRNTA